MNILLEMRQVTPPLPISFALHKIEYHVLPSYRREIRSLPIHILRARRAYTYVSGNLALIIKATRVTRQFYRTTITKIFPVHLIENITEQHRNSIFSNTIELPGSVSRCLPLHKPFSVFRDGYCAAFVKTGRQIYFRDRQKSSSTIAASKTGGKKFR